MKNSTQTLLTAITILFLACAAFSPQAQGQAPPGISGSISFFGGCTTDTGDVNTANALTSVGLDFVSTVSGDYSGVPTGGDSPPVTWTPFTFDPFVGPITPLWTFDYSGSTYSFDLTSCSIDSQGSDTLKLSGTGNLNITGFASTPCNWSLTARNIADFADAFAFTNTVLTSTRVQNVSTRGNVGTGDNVLIGGIIISGSEPATVVVRALGPSLATFGVTGALDNPTLELHDSAGAEIATNFDWKENSAEDQMVLTDNGLAPTDDFESAIVMTLDPGAYTAIVSGEGDTTGVSVVEAYNLSSDTADSLLGNISTRGNVGTGENVMIGGFILGGGGGGLPEMIVRGIGPSLTAFGVTDALADPFLELHDSEGTVIAFNDNWMDNTSEDQEMIVSRGLAPTDPNESALDLVLPIGAYTVILSGVGDTTGVGLVESYEVNGSITSASK